jgi:S1-C subfamily serine protease
MLVTNYHVIEEGIRAEAKLSDGEILSIEGVLLENMENGGRP